jgi:hypothetical protein
VPKIGILGSLVWDQIYGRDPASPPVEEWGGIAYALASLDASVLPGWEIVPLIKVGSDLSARAREFLAGLENMRPGGRCVDVPVPNNRVVLHYHSSERRTERMSGGVPGWTWSELGPMVRDLDALYVNFISGFEMALGTAQALRQGFAGPIYADLHSLLLGMQHDGVRVPNGLPNAAAWLACFDVVQLNEDEMRLLSPDPLTLAAEAMAGGVSLLIVTLGAKGAAYVADAGFERFGQGGARSVGNGTRADASTAALTAASPARVPVRSSLVPAPSIEPLDPTGCGDVFGAAAAARLFAGEPVEDALRHANAMASRNAAFRGAGGLSRHLRGMLVTP